MGGSPPRLTHSQIKPARDAIAKKLGHECPLCTGSIATVALKDSVLDHDHKTGYIRDALCRNCNQMEGRVHGFAVRAKGKLTPIQWLQNLVAYYLRHEKPQHGGIFHPTHKTEAEKRDARNAKARKKRAAAKAKE